MSETRSTSAATDPVLGTGEVMDASRIIMLYDPRSVHAGGGTCHRRTV
ncbi:MAG: hypothetical protein HYX51_07180 [Chloroflexi bacterium]|nr:hypothetical protein [Chloroflexota bacterium]